VFERVLVTGGTGFIGRYILERLSGAGIRPLVTARQNRANTSGRFDLVELDLTDSARVAEVVNAYRPQAAIHLAGVSGSQDPDGKLCRDINVTATKSLLLELDRTGCERIVMIGSAAEYGAQATPFREDMVPMAVSAYGRSKAEATAIAMAMNAASGFPVTVLRVFTAYGFGQPETMFLPQAITRALRGERFVMTDGSQRRDHVYVEDVADAIFRTLTANGAIGRVINIGSGRGLRLSHVAERVCEICGVDKGLLTIGDPSPDEDSRLDTEADITLAKEILDWSPQTEFVARSGNEGGLNKMIAQMREAQ
jgi:UDP-glucuronate 4-epimerase